MWQVVRKGEKEALIEALTARLSAPAIELPSDPATVSLLDYQHVHVTGECVNQHRIGQSASKRIDVD